MPSIRAGPAPAGDALLILILILILDESAAGPRAARLLT